MAKRIKVISKTLPKIVSTSKMLRKIEPEKVSEALGAQEVFEIDTDRNIGSISGIALRMEIAEKITSTGGRPSIAFADGEKKIPISDENWETLKVMANFLTESIGSKSKKVTPTHLASIILDNITSQFRKNPERLKNELGIK
jgi:hypothetical protein